MNREHFLELVALLQNAAEAYYNTGDLLMSDTEYDALYEKVEKVAAENGWSEADSLTQLVASGTVKNKGTITHTKPMLSMAKTKDIDGAIAFINKIPDSDVSIEPKLDGLAISFSYENGILVDAVTRGDGVKGDSVIEQVVVKTIRNLPHKLDEKISINVRGELYITHEDFEKAQTERVKLGKPAFANPRNAVAGSIKNETDNYVIMSFCVYEAVGIDSSSYLEELQHLTSLGFKTANSLMPTNLGDSAEEIIANFGLTRSSLDFPVDGIVIKANSMKVRDSLGANAKSPNWALAYKYEDEQKETKLIGIERAVGRTGAVSFTAILAPVELEGTIVQKATLNNAKYITDLDLRIGDTVIVQKANQIIPQVLGPITSLRSSDVIPYVPDTNCPQCGEPLDTESSVVWRCHNYDCSVGNAILYWGDRTVMDIDGLGEAIVEALLEQGLIKDVADLYKLSITDLSNLKMQPNKNSTQEYSLLGEKTATKLYNEIQNSKKAELYRVMAGLGIRHAGRRLSKRITAEFQTMEQIQKATIEDFMGIEGIAKDKATAIFKGIKTRAALISKLTEHGVNMGSTEVGQSVDTPEGLEFIQGKTFVITGSLEGMNRDEITTKLESFGGKAQSSVSSKTNYLIVGSNAGSKLAKAESLGVTVIPADEIISKL